MALVLVGAACSDVPFAEFEKPEGNFTPLVADSTDNVGLGNDIAVDADGVPYVSYFGYVAGLQEGQIAAARPVGAPFLPAVQVASLADDGAWTLGAVAQAVEFSNVPVPFAPTFVESLKSLDPDNANGTSIAVGEDGTRHVVYSSNNGIWYAESSADGSSTEQVYRLGTTLSVAGPLGRPGIAVDGSTPWVAWTQSVAGRQEVRVATPQGDGWRVDTVAQIGCTDCVQALPTDIGITPAGPLVVYADQAADVVMAARQDGAGWALGRVAGGAAGLGLSLAVDDRGDARVSYYAGDGTVEMAASDGGSWSTTEVGASGEIPEGTGNFAQTTGIAVDAEGAAYVAWYNAEEDSVKLAGQVEGEFQETETIGTSGGRYPSLAAGTEGRVYLAWYDVSTEDLLVGVLGEIGELVIARPSPAVEIQPPAPPSDCGEAGEIVLDIAAQSLAFDPTCLVAPAGEPFTIVFDNQDEGIDHNVAVLTEEGGDEILREPPFSGVDIVEYDLGPQEPANYFFQCDVHPTTMTGTLAVVEASGAQ